MWYGGAEYATLDGTDPLSLTVGGQAGWAQVPEGWVLAPNTAQSRAVIGRYPFGAQYVFVSDGTAYYTSLEGGSAGQQAWVSGLMVTDEGSALSSVVGNFVYERILIVSQVCGAGYIWKNRTCSPCTNTIPAGAVYSTAAGAGTEASSQCGWACGVGFFASSGGCAPCNNSRPAKSVYASAGVPVSANNCSWKCQAGFVLNGGICEACRNPLASGARYAYVTDPSGAENGCGWACNAGYRYSVVTLSTSAINTTTASASGVYSTTRLPTDKGSCVGGTVWYGGAQYATLDGTDPLSLTVGGQAGWAQVPEGWMLALNTAQSRSVIGRYPFGAQYVFVSDGTGYYTSLEGSSAGQQYYWCSWCWGYGSALSVSEQGISLNVNLGSGRILIVSQACGAGYTWTSSTNGTCSPCTNTIPAGAVYSTAAGAGSTASSQCGWVCGVGFFASSGGCAPCNNSRPAKSVYASAGVPVSANNCSWKCQAGFVLNGGICDACGNQLASNARYAYVTDLSRVESGCGWTCNAGYRYSVSAPDGNFSVSYLPGIAMTTRLPTDNGSCVGGTVW